MDTVLLARIQFAMTIGFHYIFPPLTIGMAWMIVWFQTKALKEPGGIYDEISRFWIRIFALCFAIGVATGITMEFQFGTNWAAYSRFVGDIFGAPLAAEAIFAFFLESSFLAILVYGEKRVSRKVYWCSTLIVAAASTLSAFWIIVANSWQQTPSGFKIVAGRAELVDFWAAVFNPSTLVRFGHTVSSALVVGTFFIMGISAIYLLQNKHTRFAKESFRPALIGAFIAIIMVLVIGHSHAVQVGKTQPAKLAAFEGLWDTQKNAPLLIFGLPDAAQETTHFKLAIPGGLSLLMGMSFDEKVIGLRDFAKEDRPPVLTSFLCFHLMVGLGMAFLALTVYGLWLLKTGKVFENKLFLKLMVLVLPLPTIAGEVGWMAAEIGRQPWIVYNIMRTKSAVSIGVSASEIIFSLIVFALIYTLLFALWIFLLKTKVQKGPVAS